MKFTALFFAVVLIASVVLGQDSTPPTGITIPAPVVIPTPPPPPASVVLEDGTPVHLVLSETVSSSDATAGQVLELEVVDDVLVNGYLVIPRGATAWATVTEAEHKRRLGKAGKLNVNIDKVRLADGERVLLRAIKNTQGDSHTGAVVGGTVAVALVAWPVAPLFLLMHGHDITIPKGTSISAFIQGNATLDVTKFQKQ